MITEFHASIECLDTLIKYINGVLGCMICDKKMEIPEKFALDTIDNITEVNPFSYKCDTYSKCLTIEMGGLTLKTIKDVNHVLAWTMPLFALRWCV